MLLSSRPSARCSTASSRRFSARGELRGPGFYKIDFDAHDVAARVMIIESKRHGQGPSPQEPPVTLLQPRVQACSPARQTAESFLVTFALGTTTENKGERGEGAEDWTGPELVPRESALNLSV